MAASTASDSNRLNGLWVIMDSDLNMVFLAKFFNDIQGIGLRFGTKIPMPHFLANSNTLRLFASSAGNCTTPMLTKLPKPSVFNLSSIASRCWSERSNSGDPVCSLKNDAPRDAHIFHTERRRLGNRIEDGEILESVGMNRQLPTQPVGRTGVIGGNLRPRVARENKTATVSKNIFFMLNFDWMVGGLNFRFPAGFIFAPP